MFSNYRLVSLLPQFSKVVEKLFNKRLKSFIYPKQILSNAQYSFLPDQSPLLAVLELPVTDEITSALDNSHSTFGA